MLKVDQEHNYFANSNLHLPAFGEIALSMILRQYLPLAASLPLLLTSSNFIDCVFD